jgi:cathepsin L
MYKSGVYDDQHCSSTIVDHSLVVVGYGVENGKEYYNCKNRYDVNIIYMYMCFLIS